MTGLGYFKPFQAFSSLFKEKKSCWGLPWPHGLPGQRTKNCMQSLAKWEEVPIFDSEEAEAEFWAENKPDLRLMESAVAGGSEASESVTITLRFDPRMLARIKRLARSRYLNYQSMMKQWLSERMEQEPRER
jgi:predicted DNA binding CopG/RHH family protein